VDEPTFLVVDDDQAKLAGAVEVVKEIFPGADIKERLIGFMEPWTRQTLAEYVRTEDRDVVIMDNSLGMVLGGSIGGPLRKMLGPDHSMELVIYSGDLSAWKGSPFAGALGRLGWHYGATRKDELRETLVQLRQDKFSGK
jgi:hypothetical protein